MKYCNLLFLDERVPREGRRSSYIVAFQVMPIFRPLVEESRFCLPPIQRSSFACIIFGTKIRFHTPSKRRCRRLTLRWKKNTEGRGERSQFFPPERGEKGKMADGPYHKDHIG